MAAKRSPGSGSDEVFKHLLTAIILFCIPTGITQAIGLFLLFKLAVQRGWFHKAGNVLREMFGQSGGTQTDAASPEDGWQPVTGQSRTQSQSKSRSQSQSRSAAKPLKKGGKPGTGLVIAGSIVSGIFSLATVSSFLDWIRYAYWSDLEGAAVCAIFLAAGLGMLFSGIGKNKERDRFSTYLAYIGANREVDLARMAANLGVPVYKLCKDLRKMLAKGHLPTGYVDLAEGKLFLTEMGYRPAEPKQEEKPKAEAEPAPTAEDEDAILKEIRQVNDFIPDEAMSAKIDRIEEITRRILAYQKKHPERAGQLRSFLNYYLPTTLKILRAYAQLDAQGVEGENISAAKGRIEGMMDQVVYGFEKQLDKLFQEDAMDVAADVEVLENMLKKDGLSDGQGMTLGL